ncbi:hypothetical protein U1Q18_039986 [Sarracenia purpurea var. burkii]
MPMFIGKLTYLQTLPFFVVSKDRGHKIEELRRLSNLRGKLNIYNLEDVKDREESEKENLLRKSRIHELVFHWEQDSIRDTNNINYEEVLEGLQAHWNLKCLRIENFGGQRFASWMESRDALQNLVRIELRMCIRCEQIPKLGHLSHLEVVELASLKCIGSEFYGHSEGILGSNSSSGVAGAQTEVFPALRKLTLLHMENLEEW